MSESDGGSARVPTGIAGLDEMLHGGFPSGHVVLVTGLPGTGKTCFALQFLMAGAARGEPSLFLSLEEDTPQLLESARLFGWPVDAALAKRTLTVLRVDPREAKQSLGRLQGGLGKELKELGVRRIAVDSVSLLNLLSDSESAARQTLFDLSATFRAVGATTVLTAEADPRHPGVSRDGLSEYAADGVILLGYSTAPDGRRVDLGLRILKMRRTDHARSAQPYSIGSNGLTVDARAVDFGRG